MQSRDRTNLSPQRQPEKAGTVGSALNGAEGEALFSSTLRFKKYE